MIIVQSQIGGELAHKNAMFGIVMPLGRIKHCLISKKWGKQEENGMSDLKKTKDVESQIRREDRLKTMIFGLPDCRRSKDAENLDRF